MNDIPEPPTAAANAAAAAAVTPASCASPAPAASAAANAASSAAGSTPSPTSAGRNDASSRGGRVALLVAIIALIVALTGVWYTHFIIKPAAEQTVGQVAAQLTPLAATVDRQQASLALLERQMALMAEQGAKVAALHEQIVALSEALSQSRERLARSEAALDQLKGIAQAAAEMTAALSRVGDRRWLVEAAETLTFAERQLTWNGNLDAAQAALELLSQRLGNADRPVLRPLREALEADLLAIRSAPRIDRDGLIAKLTALEQRLDEAALAFTAPLSVEQVISVAEPTAWYQRLWSATVAFGRAVGQEWANWLRLERLDAAAPELLSPQQALTLHLNLAAWVASARLAVDKGDSAGYQAALAAVDQAVRRFLAADPTRQAIEQILGELKAAPVAARRLTLTRSLAALAELESRLSASVAP